MNKRQRKKAAAEQLNNRSVGQSVDMSVAAFGQTEKIENSAQTIQNGGFADALGFNTNPFGSIPGMGSSMEQVSDTTTLFTNLRWYLISNFRQVLTELYVEIGLIKTIVDVPVDDGLRGGVEIKSQQLDENQIKDLKHAIDRDDIIGTIGQAAKWNRLFGGAGILILVDNQDPEEPLNLDTIGPDTNIIFRSCDMWELFWDKQNAEGYDPEIQTEEFQFYDYYASKVHKSRVMRLKGQVPPSFIRPRLRGWGFSVVETLVRSINQYLKATDLTFEVLDEFKIDVYKIKNLVNTLLSPNGQTKIQQRVQLANWQKNYQNAVVMDSEDDWDHKQLSFAGLAEAQAGIRKQVAADMRMPITKLFGASDSTASIGTADQNDMENYNSMVEGEVRNKIKFDILRILEIKCQNLFSFIPDDLELEFKPLRVLSAEQDENVKTQKFARLFQAKQVGEISTEEFRDACNKGQLFDVKLDTSQDVIGGFGDEINTEDEIAEGTHDPKDTKDTVDPGANRFDSRTPRAAIELSSRTGEKMKNALVPKKIENPGKVDESLWTKAKDASKKAWGRIKWPFVTWWYKKQGGTFG